MTKDDIYTAKQLESLDLEKAIVARLLVESIEHIREVRTVIQSRYFYNDKIRHVYRVILSLVDKGSPVNMLTVTDEIMRLSKVDSRIMIEIQDFNNTILTYVDLLYHCDVLTDYAKRRDFYVIGKELEKEGTQPGADIQTVGAKIKQMIDDTINDGGGGTLSMTDVLKALQKTVDDNYAGNNEVQVIKCGFTYLDNKDAISLGDLDIIAADSSSGKTSFAISLMRNIAEQGIDCLYFSTEMLPSQIGARCASYYTHIYSNHILKRKLEDEQMKAFDVGVGNMWNMSSHIHFHDKNTSNINEILQSIRHHAVKMNVKVVFVDFIQRLTGRTHEERGDDDFYRRISQQLKDLALELNICVILLSQLNRSLDNSKDMNDQTKFIPTQQRIRGSGQIFEAADNVWFIYRPDYYNKEYGKSILYPTPFNNVQTENTAMIICAKGRNIGTGSFIVGFHGDTTSFYDIEGNVPLRAVQVNKIDNNESDGKMPF